MADVSVRPARPADAEEIGRIQVETWRTAYGSVLPAVVLEGLDVPMAVDSWREAVTSSPSPRHHVFLALEEQQAVGFAALAPAEDLEPDAEDPEHTGILGPVLVEPRWGRRGHGSRLLAAAVEHARRDELTRLILWVPEADSVSRTFFGDAGWAADGYARSFDTGAGELREVRLHTTL